MKYLTIFIALFFAPIATASVANISQIIFVSEMQTVAPDAISKVFTIQTQSSSGLLEAIDETSDLSVSVNSSTGQFNSNSTSWNPATTFTMSKNTGNKNFYYKDPTIGTYTITATLTTRESGKSWTTSQNVIVSSDIDSDDEDDSDSTSTSTTVQITKTSSTHSSQEELSDLAEVKSKLKISLGRDRTVFAGVPVEFEAQDNTSGDPENSRVKFSWSFGDGSSTRGAGARHIYMYPGEYNVVVNGEYRESKSVARLKLTVLAPDLILARSGDDSISVKNKNKNEVNLSGYGLWDGQQRYIFPADTIIFGGQTIILPKEYVKFSYQGREVLFVDYLGRKLFSLI